MAMRTADFVAVIAVFTGPRANHHVGSEHCDGDSGGYPEPGIKLFGHDVFGGVQGNRSQKIYTGCVRSSNDDAEEDRVPRRSTRSYEVRRHNGFAVPRFKRVQRAKSCCN